MSEWISVKNRLPELYECVLSWASGDKKNWFPIVLYYTESGWNEQYVVSNWMPLPEPPKD